MTHLACPYLHPNPEQVFFANSSICFCVPPFLPSLFSPDVHSGSCPRERARGRDCDREQRRQKKSHLHPIQCNIRSSIISFDGAEIKSNSLPIHSTKSEHPLLNKILRKEFLLSKEQLVLSRMLPFHQLIAMAPRIYC